MSLSSLCFRALASGKNSRAGESGSNEDCEHDICLATPVLTKAGGAMTINIFNIQCEQVTIRSPGY